MRFLMNSETVKFVSLEITILLLANYGKIQNNIG